MDSQGVCKFRICDIVIGINGEDDSFLVHATGSNEVTEVGNKLLSGASLVSVFVAQPPLLLGVYGRQSAGSGFNGTVGTDYSGPDSVLSLEKYPTPSSQTLRILSFLGGPCGDGVVCHHHHSSVLEGAIAASVIVFVMGSLASEGAVREEDFIGLEVGWKGGPVGVDFVETGDVCFGVADEVLH